MGHANFVHLRVHSAYSLSEGAIKLNELSELCVLERMPAVAITDHNNLFGAIEFSEICKDSGIQPILGCEISVKLKSSLNTNFEEREYPSIIVLAQNKVGWKNLIKLSSEAHLKSPVGEYPHICLEQLASYSEGLLALSGGPGGLLGTLLLSGNKKDALSICKHLAKLFPDKFYIELMRHDLESEKLTEDAFLDFAYECNLPLVATNNVYFGPKQKFQAHDALMCISRGNHIDDKTRKRLTPDHYFRSAPDMIELFKDIPEAIDNTLVIAKRCSYMAPTSDPILPAFPVDGGMTEAETLKLKAENGLKIRLENFVLTDDMSENKKIALKKNYFDRLHFELSVIIDMKFPGYFLIVAEFISWAKSENIPVGPGRGSGAGSLVAWALTITDLDPIRFGLLFERFLNPERISMPDFDIDFCQENRDKVIDHVCERYGSERVAQIITFGKLQARAVIRDVGRVLGMPYGQVDKLSKLVPYNPANPMTLQEAIDSEPQFKSLIKDDEAIDHLLKIALQLEGLFRHASTHAAGVVIGDQPLQEIVPLYRDPRSEMPVTQYSMKSAEKAGLVKFDFLGLKTLSVLHETCRLINKKNEISINLSVIPLDDTTTYSMLGSGASMGVFQLESSGMRDVLRNMKPDTFEDIIALVALYRPGPMSNIPKFIACKHGKEMPDYMHPSLEEILKETYGVIVYQEQVMEIAQVLSGYSLGEADLLRRAMGKKIKSEMSSQRDTFVEGALQNGVTKTQASRIFDLVAKFADYGFNKSHAAAYALIAYQTAYLKANYPVEFMAASMSFELRDTDKLSMFRQELNRLQIPLLPPDINLSNVLFTVEKQDLEDNSQAIRYALAAIKNVGDNAIRNIVDEREKNGPYNDIFDFARRLGSGQINRRQLESLVCAGSFDGLENNRKRLYESVETLLRISEYSNVHSGQDSLFDSNQENTFSLIKNVSDWPHLERLNYEHSSIGFYLSSHPLKAYSQILNKLNVVHSHEFKQKLQGGISNFQIAGVILSIQKRETNGRQFAFVSLSDPSGSFEIAFFSDVFSATRDILEPGKFLVIRAVAKKDGDQIKLVAQGAEDLEKKAMIRMKGVEIYLSNTMPLAPLKTLLERQDNGNGEIVIIANTLEGHNVELRLNSSYVLSPALTGEISSIPGVDRVKEI